MSFDSHSELQPHLLALAQMNQWHTDKHQMPLELRYTVQEGTVTAVQTAITGDSNTPAPADYSQMVTVAVFDLAQSQNFSGSFAVRINTNPGGRDAIIKQTPLVNDSPQPQAAPQPSHNIYDEGLQLRSALLSRGHCSGYSPDEITAEEKERGFDLPPEVKFYRTLVREGLITQVNGQDVMASSPQADFGAAALDSLPWKAPATNNGAVQAVLNHRLWIEIAHSDSHLYALDLAPGPSGTSGQIIARPVGEASVPVQVASSLAHFVAGELLQDPASGRPTQETAPQESPQEKTVAWVGCIDPIAFPALLGWAEIPAESRYRELVQGLTGVAPGAAESPSQDSPTTAPTVATADDGTSRPSKASEDASTLFSGSRDMNEPGQEGQVFGREQDESASTQLDSLELAELKTEQDTEDFDPGIASAPISPEQKNIATTIGTLAFGTKEQREEYRATDTSPIPQLQIRGKKLSLTSASPGQVAAQREGRRAESSLRSALRKFFSTR